VSTFEAKADIADVGVDKCPARFDAALIGLEVQHLFERRRHVVARKRGQRPLPAGVADGIVALPVTLPRLS
jgi:hypothetical protein